MAANKFAVDDFSASSLIVAKHIPVQKGSGSSCVHHSLRVAKLNSRVDEQKESSICVLYREKKAQVMHKRNIKVVSVKMKEPTRWSF